MKHLQAWLDHLEHGKELRPATVENYRQAILSFERETKIEDPAEVTTLAPVDRFVTRLSIAGIDPRTRNGRIGALKRFYRFLELRGLVTVDPTKEISTARLRETRRIPILTPREVEKMVFDFRPAEPVRGKKEREQMFRVRQRVARLTAARDSALLALMYSQGLRRSEPGRMARGDYSRDAKGRPYLVIREGKWMDEPVARGVDARAAALLDIYLLEMEAAGVRSAALFPPIGARKKDTRRGKDDGVDPRTVNAIFLRRARAVGISGHGRRLSPHILRYSICTHLNEAGMPDLQLQTFMRHKSFETTRRYIRLGSEKSITRRAIGLLPWNRRGARPGPTTEPRPPQGAHASSRDSE